MSVEEKFIDFNQPAKTCCVCKETKPITEFYIRKDGKRKSRYCCKPCHSTVSKRHYVKYRDRITKRMRQNSRDRKQTLINEFGGKCLLCGYSKCITALDFHHVNPDEKKFIISKQRNIDRARTEAAKCVILCANCHREVEAGMTIIKIPVHF